jgi:hypothetical protein
MIKSIIYFPFLLFLILAQITLADDTQKSASKEKDDFSSEKIKSLISSCEKNKVQSCYEIGQYFVDHHKSSEAVAHLEKACKSNFERSCVYLAIAYDESGKSNQVAPLLGERCNSGDKAACTFLTQFLDHQDKATQEQCDKGIRSACEEIAIQGGAKRIVNIWNWANKDRWRLTQKVNGYALFSYPFVSSVQTIKYKIALKIGPLVTNLVENQTLTNVLPKQCMKFIRNDSWETERGFSTDVKIYEAVECTS